MFHNDLLSSQAASGEVEDKNVVFEKGFQDPVHANQMLYFSPLAIKIIDTPEVLKKLILYVYYVV